MSIDRKQIEQELQQIDAVWSKTRPGKKVCGRDIEGHACVFQVENIATPLGKFQTEDDAKAYAMSAEHIDRLCELVVQLMDERDEARQGLQEICRVADPAYEAFNEHKPVDMATVLKIAHRWGYFVLRS